jgi:hypothetical protein
VYKLLSDHRPEKVKKKYSNHGLSLQQKIERREIVWKMRLENKTYQAIADHLGVTPQTVENILYRLHTKHKKWLDKDIERVKCEQIVQLENVAQEAYDAWERSKWDVRKNRPKDPDPKYLAVYLRCKEDIRKITGAYHEPKNSTDLKIIFDNLPASELQKYLADKPLTYRIELTKPWFDEAEKQQQLEHIKDDSITVLQSETDST